MTRFRMRVLSVQDGVDGCTRFRLGVNSDPADGAPDPVGGTLDLITEPGALRDQLELGAYYSVTLERTQGSRGVRPTPRD